MFSLIFVASLVLPSVLGHCCFPDRMSTIVFTSGNVVPHMSVIDFTKDKLLMTYTGGDVISTLADMKEGKSYNRFADGSCSVENQAPVYKQCIPDSAALFATVTLAGQVVDGYRVKISDDSHVTNVVKPGKECLPVVMITKMADSVETKFFTNVTSTVDDVSGLNQSVSDCQ